MPLFDVDAWTKSMLYTAAKNVYDDLTAYCLHKQLDVADLEMIYEAVNKAYIEETLKLGR